MMQSLLVWRRYAACLLVASLFLSACDDEGDDDTDPTTPDGMAADATPDAIPDAIPDATEDASVDAMAPDGAMPDETIAALIAAVDLTRYSDDLEFIARGPRPSPDGENWQAAQDRCAEVFLGAGLEVVRQPFHGGGVNVIGVLPGMTRPDEQLVIGAHYDTVGSCNGADDNASGVAGVLEAARVLGGRRFERTLVFACFDAEEYGLLGSADYATGARERGDDVRGMISLEMIGYADATPGSQAVPDGLAVAFPQVDAAFAARERRGDFLFGVGDDDPMMMGHLRAAAEVTGLPLIDLALSAPLRASPQAADFQRSDHASFWSAGYPAIMLTDTAEFRNQRYHCDLGDDDIDAIDFDFAIAVTRTVVGALAAAAVPAEGAPAVGREVEAAPARGAPMLVCDPVAGTCEGGERCTVVVAATTALACVPPSDAPLGIDAPCMRDAAGRDTCAPGLLCSLTGRSLAQGRRCRPLCLSAADCEAGQICPWIGAEAGNCIEPCDPFADECLDGTTCGIGASNDFRSDAPRCVPTGPVGEGGDCSQADCQPGLLCTTLSLRYGFGCLARCDLDAPVCSAGRTCRQIGETGLPDNLGLCLPSDRLVD